MRNPKKDGNSYKTIMKNQLSTPETSLGIAKNLWKTKSTYVFKGFKVKAHEPGGYKVCSGMCCHIDTSQ